MFRAGDFFGYTLFVARIYLLNIRLLHFTRALRVEAGTRNARRTCWARRTNVNLVHLDILGLVLLRPGRIGSNFELAE